MYLWPSVIRGVLFAVLISQFASAQVTASPEELALKELRSRALDAAGARPLSTGAEAVREKARLLAALEGALSFGYGRPLAAQPVTLYLPKPLDRPAPSVIIFRPHIDPASPDARALGTSLAQLGFIAVTLDLRADHEYPALVSAGISPAGLMQRNVRSALTMLRANKLADSARIVLLGEGLQATLAYAINPEFAAAALVDAAPDLEGRISSGNFSDPCDLTPAFLARGSVYKLWHAIAPRPVLSINSQASSPAQFVRDSYSTAGSLLEQEAGLDSAYGRRGLYQWLSQRFADDRNRAVPPESAPRNPDAQVVLEQVTAAKPLPPQPLGIGLLRERLGRDLPYQLPSWGLQVTRQLELELHTQPGITNPAIVLRPGPEGGAAERGALLALSDKGRQSLLKDEIVEQAVRLGWVVWAIDPRGIVNPGSAAVQTISSLSLLLGEDFAWRQASDVGRIADRLVPGFAAHRVWLYARGDISGLIAQYVGTGAFGAIPERILLRESPKTFDDVTSLHSYPTPFDVGGLNLSTLPRFGQTTIMNIDAIDQFLDAEWFSRP